MRWLWIIPAALCGILLVAAAAFWLARLPLANGLLAAALDRAGIAGRAEVVRLDWRGAALHDVDLGGHRAARIEIAYAPGDLVATGQVDGVEIHGLRLSVDLTAEQPLGPLPDRLAALFAGDPTAPPAAGLPALPPLRLEDARIALRTARGALELALTGGIAAPDATAAQAVELSLVSRPGDGAKPDRGLPPGLAGRLLGVRLDGEVVVGSRVSPNYDSLLVKLTCKEKNFEGVIQKMFRALSEFRVRGVKTNIPFLLNVLQNETFLSGQFATDFIDSTPSLFDLETGSDDMTIRLWDWDKGWANTQTYEGHSHYVMMVAFNPKDANTFASASLDRTIKVWGLNTLQPHFTLEGHEKGVNCVEYFSGGDRPYLVSGADDRTVKGQSYPIHCRKTRQGSQALPGSQEEIVLDHNVLGRGKAHCDVQAIEMSPDHALLAFTVDFTGYETYDIIVRDLQSGTQTDKVEGCAGQFTD